MTNLGAVVCIGEILIDFFCTDIEVGLVEGSHFLKQAGGAPANVAAAIAKLGGRSLFVGKVGEDPFGIFLRKTLQDFKVDTTMLIQDPSRATTLAFVSLQSDGERDFIFQRGADQLLTLEEVNLSQILQSKIIHFGSATAMLGGPSHDTYFKVMEAAKRNNVFLSFDPNYREFLWKGKLDTFTRAVKEALSYADFVKVSEEELELISGTDRLEDGVNILHHYGVKWIAVTLGKEGAFVSNGQQNAFVRSIPVKAIDSTGAGDAFVGAFLFQLAQYEDPYKAAEDFDNIKHITSFANHTAAFVCTKMGAMTSLPTYEMVINMK